MQAGSSMAPNDSALGSEDCLTLNVWRPARDAKRPVMVFIHGGYFAWGSSSYRKDGVDLYDGAQLAAHGDVVVVTLNYRIGPFGYLAHPALAAEDPHHSTGDYGLLDQLAALAWVQRNIAAFGGDPQRVTIFGQSAGAISTGALYASPLARGLFAGAILHSGNGDAIPLRKAERGGITLAHQLGCDRAEPAATVACLRAQSATAIAAALPESFAPDGQKYGPVVDGYALPAKPIELVERGQHNHVPLIVATTSNEYSTMIHSYIDGPISTADDYAAMVARRFPRMASRLVAEYPATAYATPLAAYTAMWGDVGFTCQSNWLADAAAAHQHEPVYRFVFDHGYAGKLERFGAGHGMDLYMVFHNLPPYITFDASEQQLSQQLTSVWAAFAHGTAPDWPARGTHGETEVLDRTLHAAAPATDHCAFWKPMLGR
jgi:para-nitrobenzyl esterase